MTALRSRQPMLASRFQRPRHLSRRHSQVIHPTSAASSMSSRREGQHLSRVSAVSSTCQCTSPPCDREVPNFDSILQGAVLTDSIHHNHFVVFFCFIAWRLPGKFRPEMVPEGIQLKNRQFLYIDLFIIIPVAVASKLRSRLPCNQTANQSYSLSG